MKKIYKCLPAIVFVGFIGVMLILFLVLPKQAFSASEKRYLEKMPAFSAKSFFFPDDKENSFQKHFEDYIADHTAGRNFWVGFNAYYNYALGNNASKGVYNSRDDYLINDPEQLDLLTRNTGFIEEFAEHLEMTEKKVPVTVAVAPSTGYVCEDKLPDFHFTYHDDKVFPEMAKTFKTADFVDLREPLKTAYEDGDQVFYRTDHHWTTRGAYTAYRAIADSLGVTPNGEDVYDKTAYPGFYGTTYSTSGYWLTEPDDIEVWDNTKNDITVTVIDGETKEQQDMFFYDHLDENDKYPVFLDGNHPYTVIRNNRAKTDEKLLVVKDSFAHSLVPFLADHYAEIIMVDMRYYSMPLLPIIENEGITRVLFLYSIDNLGTDKDIGRIE